MMGWDYLQEISYHLLFMVDAVKGVRRITKFTNLGLCNNDLKCVRMR